MKFFFNLIFALTYIAASAQTIIESKVPKTVIKVFSNAYPNMVGKWVKEDGNYEVAFKKDSKKMTLVINPAGTLIQTEYAITIAELPKAAIDYLGKNAKGVKINEVAHILKPNGEVQFEAEVKDKDILFDENGNFLSKEK